jgi:short subunit dehydrogenase-like uncharacterized protein
VTARIVLFGATGYTGRLTAEALAARGAQPVLAGRSRDRLIELATELGGLDTAVADAGQPETVHQLVSRGDVLVTTVGPFARYGGPALEAAVRAGATYFDSTGEPGFLWQLFDEWSPKAERAGAALIPAFGYDFVPGNAAAAVALEEAGDAAVRVDVGYFATGTPMMRAMSSGTLATMVGSASEPAVVYRDWRLEPARAGRSVRTFDVAGGARSAFSMSASEHFAVPRLAPGLREVNVYNGWFGPFSRVIQGVSAVNAVASRLPGSQVVRGLAAKITPTATGRGPDADERARTGSEVVAVVYDAAGEQLAEARLTGPNGYELTADLLAWGAIRAAEGAVVGTGALGPVDAFGLPALLEGLQSAGMKRL